MIHEKINRPIMLHVKSIGDPLHLKKQNTGAVLKKAGGNISLPQIKSFVSVWQKEKFWPTKTSLNVLPAEWKKNHIICVNQSRS